MPHRRCAEVHWKLVCHAKSATFVSMEIETERLLLRPVDRADVDAIAHVIFGDPKVVGILAHNTKDPADARDVAERWVRLMGRGSDMWSDGGMGLFALVPNDGDGALAGVSGFFMERDENERWTGEYFYALGSAWHGRGLMSDVADVLGARLRKLPSLGVIYAGYWDMINEGSGKILLRTGLKPAGRKPITAEYSPERCVRMFEYDVWRTANAHRGTERNLVLLQAARRAGGFVAEDVVAKDDAMGRLANAFGGDLTTEALAMFDKARRMPGMAYLEIRGKGETGIPVNRLSGD